MKSSDWLNLWPRHSLEALTRLSMLVRAWVPSSAIHSTSITQMLWMRLFLPDSPKIGCLLYQVCEVCSRIRKSLTSPGFTITAGLTPAFAVDPVKHGNLDPSYLEATVESGAEFLLFYGPDVYYNRTFIHQDYLNRGTITIGEAASCALVPTASDYKNPVLVIDGEQDTVFCGSLGLEPLGPGNCGFGSTSKPAQTQIIYPSANYSVSSARLPLPFMTFFFRFPYQYMMFP